MTAKTAKRKAAPKARKEVAAPASARETIVAVKGFNADWKCLDFQYEIGKTYKLDGRIEVCDRGFHACEMPFDVWRYYKLSGNVFAEVELVGPFSRSTDGDTKIAAAEITIRAELKLPEIIKRAGAWILAKAKGNTATARGTHAAATGDCGHAAATGYCGHAAATGDCGHAAATGNYGHAAATGNSGIAAALGISSRAKASATGAIVLANFNDDRSIRHIRASKVGENGVQADKWYRLNKRGEFEEVT